METKAEVLKYMFTRIQEMLPVNVVKAKKNKDYFTYIVENDCSIEFYFQTTQGGYAGKNTFCMGVSAKIKNPYLCSLVLEPLNKKDAGGNIIVCFDFQEDALRPFCGSRIKLQTIDFSDFERRFLNSP